MSMGPMVDVDHATAFAPFRIEFLACGHFVTVDASEKPAARRHG